MCTAVVALKLQMGVGMDFIGEVRRQLDGIDALELQ